MKTVIIEGWRFIPHSYAMVNQHQCLELLKRPDIKLFHRDVPYFFPTWKPAANLWSPEDEAKLRSIQPPPAGIKADATFRIGFPHFFNKDPQSTRTITWVTSEFGTVHPSAIGSRRPPREALSTTEATIVACSNWAAKGFLNSGAPRDKVVVVPCGVDTGIFKPVHAERRAALRKQFGWENKFVILNVSAMTGNKGIQFLLKAAAAQVDKHPEIAIVLKGADDLYRSLANAQGAFGALTPAEAGKIQPRMSYIGTTIPTEAIANFMQAADLYVSPYTGEGFNLPVLEAVACGLPVVCTKGGSTDDFVADDFALRIKSMLLPTQDGGLFLEPNVSDLAALIGRAIEDQEFRTRAAQAGPVWVTERFTWKHAVDKLLRVMLPETSPEAGAR